MNSSVKKKILIILSSDLFIRNYLTTYAFTEIEKYYDCFYMADESIVHKSKLLKKNFVGYYKFEKDIKEKHYRIFNVLMYKYRHKSSSFQFRIKRSYHNIWKFDKRISNWKKPLLIPLLLFRTLKTKAFYFVYGNAVTYPLFEKFYIQTLPINKIILDTIQEVQPSIVLFPSSAYDPEGNDIARVCKKLHIPSLFLIDNWDNLSSKSMMWIKPDYLGVWGEQSVEHAIKIQGLEKNKISIIGTPRFDEYFRNRDTNLKSHFKFKYILFVGTALAFDEAGVLYMIDKLIEKNPIIFNGTKVVYRPHPWRQSNDTIVGTELPNIIIDPQLYDSYRSGNTGLDVQPDVDYYPSLIKNAEFIVGGLTTMIIEALIFKKRVLALAYDDGINFTSPHNVLKYYVHFQGIKDIEIINFCTDLQKLEADFIDTWNSRNLIDPIKIDLQRNYFLNNDEKPYNLRLVELVNKILQDYSFSQTI